jgi:hypothetical protein
VHHAGLTWFREAPVPTLVSMIWSPEAVVMGFPVVWADAGVTKGKAARENESARNLRRCMVGLLIVKG